MTLDSWTPLARKLIPFSFSGLVFYVVVIMLMTVLINNLITAIIIHTAMGRNDKDEEMVALMRREKLEAELSNLKDVFRILDRDGNGNLSIEELKFENMRQNKYVVHALEPLNLSL